MTDKKMNRKGEAEPRTAIVPAVIAVVVLVIVVIALYLFFSGKITFFKGLPGFNDTKPPVTDLEFFRYLIPEVKLQYYDGTRWNNLGTTLEANEHKFVYDKLRSDITNNFLLREFAFPENADLGVKFRADGALLILFTNKPVYYFTMDGRLYGDPNDDPLAAKDFPAYISPSLLNKLAEWRNSFLNESVVITYMTKEGDKEIQGEVETCYLSQYYYEHGKWSLVVDLSRPLGEGEKCPY